MNDFFKNFSRYIKMPEMKILWLFLFLALLIFIIDIIYLEYPWTLISLLLILLIGIVAFIISLRTAKINNLLRVEKARVKNIISTMTDGIIIYDQEFTISLFSEAAESIFNIRKEEILGKKLSPESVRDPKMEILGKVIFQSLAPLVIRQSPEGVYPQVVDISFEEPRLDLRVTTDRIMDSNKQVVGFLKIVRDRTREVEFIKSKNDFITIAAHQLRTPLSAVSWAFESLEKELIDKSQKELVDAGLGASNNLLKIVEDLLNVAKIEEGKFGYKFKKIDFVSFLQSTLDQISPVAREYNVKIYLEPPKETSILIEIDPEKIILAVSNLLENAIKYNVPNGQVVVSIERKTDAPFIQVNIADTGIGVPESEISKLFTKFFRGEGAANKATGGSGLGLHIVKNIIRRHGGQVWAESVVGRGSTFHFTLPTDSRLIPQKEISSYE